MVTRNSIGQNFGLKWVLLSLTGVCNLFNFYLFTFFNLILRDIPASFFNNSQQIVNFERNYASPEDMRQTRAADRIKGRYLR
jgi:hypothetical protein